MSIESSDLKKLVKIVKQYEVIYGGGISSSDAAIREECDQLVATLEAELGGPGKKQAGKKGRDSLPSLVEATKAPKAEKAPRPVSGARSSEIAGLAKPQKKEAGASAPAKAKSTVAAQGRSGKAAAGTSAPAKSTTAKGSAAKNAPAKGAAQATKRKAAVAGKAAAAGKASPSGKSTAIATKKDLRVSDNGEPDLRSKHQSASRAADVRAERLMGEKQGDGSEPGESKRRFAATHLFEAFRQNKLPKYGGFIVCVRFAEETGYTVIELIGYENLQDLYPEGDTLVFKSVGCKLYAIVEPATYLLKSVEPVNRPMEQMVPYRFNELLRITTKRFQNILVGRKPVFMPTSFSVFKPSGEDLAVLFYDTADVYTNIQDFLIMLLRDRLYVPVADSRKAGEVIARGIREFKLWLDEA